MKFARSSGILLHPTSLPGRFGIGDLGQQAYQFVDFLAAGRQQLWQVMPLGPTGYGDSPYQGFSAFAGNPMLISPDQLVEAGFLGEDDLKEVPPFNAERIEFGHVIEYKMPLLRKAFENYANNPNNNLREQLDGFRHYAESWLADYALFAALKDAHNGAEWNSWEAGLARRNKKALDRARRELGREIAAHEFYQYLFFRQWLELKGHAKNNGIKIIGDVPIFVAHNSADVWSHPDLFKLDEHGNPTVVAGVPPDNFSETGQLWGNPLYNWERMRETGYQWWVERLRATLRAVDIARLDHFRGFAACWEVPAADETAANGEWVETPGRELFGALQNSLGEAPLLAEDLGVITPDVEALRDELGLPGMRILQFAFGGDSHNLHLPHNYINHTVVYTGTHDNDTVVGWFTGEADENTRQHCQKYLRTDGQEIHRDFMRAALASVADVAIIAAQDLLGLDSSARMNTPASGEGNWAWRMQDDALSPELSERLKEMTELFGRAAE